MGAERESLTFILKAVWKMENLQQVNDVIILCFRKNWWPLDGLGDKEARDGVEGELGG